jgi:hypothetical protein
VRCARFACSMTQDYEIIFFSVLSFERQRVAPRVLRAARHKTWRFFLSRMSSLPDETESALNAYRVRHDTGLRDVFSVGCPLLLSLALSKGSSRTTRQTQDHRISRRSFPRRFARQPTDSDRYITPAFIPRERSLTPFSDFFSSSSPLSHAVCDSTERPMKVDLIFDPSKVPPPPLTERIAPVASSAR